MPKICSFRHFPGLDSGCYQFEATRFASFKTWPQDCPVSACALSKNGWYFSDDSDDDGATTFCCNKRCKDWAMGDNPMEKHKLLSPLCPLARGQDMWRADGLPVFNIPIPTADAPCVNFSNAVYSFDNRNNRAGMVAVQETGGQVDVDVQHRHLSAVAQRLGVRLRTPSGGDPRPHPLPSSADGSAMYTAHCEPRDGHFPTFASLEKRILTFQNFPRDLHLDIEAIAKLGFFYTGDMF
ncbi:hypothetical protein C0Q70_11021 [Pomacea canaliculata]|uniref:Uncharacterized protein n=1 Tax=Pomacea canaliculata TaxID=400727 RepID=A0A2T7P4T6_POMCA|nr:hypothetical protein C0Q70_11021 [Pomacea canaliculata]